MIADVLVEARPASAGREAIAFDVGLPAATLGVAPKTVSIRPRLTIARIQEVVAAYYDLAVDDMTSSCRQRCCARPRQVAMYLARELTFQSFPNIGARFGGRDHTTVIHAINAVRERMSADNRTFDDVQRLTGFLS